MHVAKRVRWPRRIDRDTQRSQAPEHHRNFGLIEPRHGGRAGRAQEAKPAQHPEAQFVFAVAVQIRFGPVFEIGDLFVDRRLGRERARPEILGTCRFGLGTRGIRRRETARGARVVAIGASPFEPRNVDLREAPGRCTGRRRRERRQRPSRFSGGHVNGYDGKITAATRAR
jgi:hypothetical protein